MVLHGAVAVLYIREMAMITAGVPGMSLLGVPKLADRFLVTWATHIVGIGSHSVRGCQPVCRQRLVQ